MKIKHTCCFLFLLMLTSCNAIKKASFSSHIMQQISKENTVYVYGKKTKFNYDTYIKIPCKVNGNEDTAIFLSDGSFLLNKELKTDVEEKQGHSISMKVKKMKFDYNNQELCTSSSCYHPYKKLQSKGIIKITCLYTDWETDFVKHDHSAATISFENFNNGWEYTCRESTYWELAMNMMDKAPVLKINFSDSTIMLSESLSQKDTLDYQGFRCSFDGFPIPCSSIPRIHCKINDKEEIVCFNLQSSEYMTVPISDYKNSGTWVQNAQDRGIFGIVEQKEVVNDLQNIQIEGLMKAGVYVTYSPNAKLKEIGMAFISHFDWIFDYQTGRVYCRMIRPFHNISQPTPLRKVQIVNAKLQIVKSPISERPVNTRIRSVDGIPVTSDNICHYKQLLNQTADWSIFQIEYEEPEKED